MKDSTSDSVMSKHAIFIILAGLAGNACYLWGQYDGYLQGREMRSIHSFGTFFMIFGLLGLAVCLVAAGIAAIYRAIARKKFQPLIACAVVPLMCGVVAFVPMPSHIQGVAETLATKDEAFYVAVAGWLRKQSEEKGDQDTPRELFVRFPQLGDLFPDHAEEGDRTRFHEEAGYTDVWTGGGHGGHRGFRVYEKEGESPYPASGGYVGSFRKIHPRVYGYTRSF